MSGPLEISPRVRYGEQAVSSLRERARLQSYAPDLREELAILRELLNDAIGAYDHAVDEATTKGLDIHRVKNAAGGLVAMAIDRIERVAATQCRITSAKFMAMPDVHMLIEGMIGTIDSELAQHAGQLRMTGMDPTEFMNNVAEKLRRMQQATAGAAMATFGPSGQSTLDANEEAAFMDDTVPECHIKVEEVA
jgi:hypothetical protein